MIRVLPILAAVFALAVTAAPASAASKETEPHPHRTWTFGESGETYLDIKIENVHVTDYR